MNNIIEAIIVFLLILGFFLALAVWLFRLNDKEKANRLKQIESTREVFDPKVVEYAKKKVTYYGTYRGGEVRKACRYYQKEYDEGRLKLPFQGNG